MEQQTRSPKFLRQRKLLMVLPLLILPFITLMFWALGGGKTGEVTAQSELHKGFNMQLPDAYLKEEKELDKMSYYREAQSDSAKLKQQMKNDPYYQTDAVMYSVQDPPISMEYSGSNRINPTFPHESTYQDINEARVYQKLKQLNAAMEEAENVTERQSNLTGTNPTSHNSTINSVDLDRMSQMMQTMNHSEGTDPEMQQINEVLEKILDIQHPDRVQSRLKQFSPQKEGQVLAVSSSYNDPVSLMENNPSFKSENGSTNTSEGLQVSNRFYSIDDQTESNGTPKAIEAIVHETQTLVNGSTVKFSLLHHVNINGILIPKNSFLFGTASLNNERLRISINSIRFQNLLLPVDLTVYDLDGINGIYVPGAISRDVAKQSADRAVQGMGLNTFDTSVGIQAASAGIEAAKNIFSKKVKLTKVTVKAGYRVLLRDEKQQQDI